jgi:hypothetical protein
VIDKWDYMKLKNCRIRQEMVSKLKRPPTERKKIFPRSTSDKLKKLNCQKINELIKWATELNRTFSKEEVQMAKKHMKKCSPSLAVKEMQIKTTLRFHLTPVELLPSRTTPTTNVGENAGKKEPSYTAGENVSWCNHYRKQCGSFFKKINKHRAAM